MNCSVCGSEVSSVNKFCPSCGSPVAVAAAADAVEGAAQTAAGASEAAMADQPIYDQVGAQGIMAPPEQQYQGSYQQPGYQQNAYQQPGYQQPGYQQPSYQQPMQVWPQQPLTSRAFVMCVYLGNLIPLIIALCMRDKNDPFITHHLNQALVCFIGAIVSAFLCFLIIGIFTGIFFFVMMIMGMVRAYQSSMEPLPLIGSIQILK